MTILDGVELVDHHCHGIVTRDLDRDGFEALICEADRPGPSHGTLFDTQVGLAIRRWCAPLLGLPSHAPAADYIARRIELGTAEVNRRLMASVGTSEFLVDTGFMPSELTSPGELAALAGGKAHEIVRLEYLAEQVGGTVAAGDFPDAFRQRLRDAAAGAVGVKSIAAYRVGLDLDPVRATDHEVVSHVSNWFRAIESGAPVRLADKTIVRFLIWTGVDLGLPIQFHVGYGDADLNLRESDPLLLTPLLRATATSGVPIMLLHNYPFHRSAGYLAQVFDHVFVDVGLALHNVGFRASSVLSELLELAPFGSVLFSSDAFGLPELYVVATELFRRALSEVLEDGIGKDYWSIADAERFAAMICAENARRAYRLESP